MKENILRIIRKILTVGSHDQAAVKEVKGKFEHHLRSFSYGLGKFFVDSLYCHATPGTLETTIEMLAAWPQKGALLNLGGGTGQVAAIFKAIGFDVFNLDIEIKKEDENERNRNFDLNSSLPLPFAEQRFQAIVCQEIIEHVENPWKLLRTAKGALLPGGLLILSTPNTLSLISRLKFVRTGFFSWFTPDCFGYHINPLFDWEIRLIAEKIGLELVAFKGSGNYFFGREKNRSISSIVRNNEGLIYAFKIRN